MWHPTSTDVPGVWGGKSQPEQAPLLNIEANQPPELIYLDDLKIEPNEGYIENVLVITDHFARYAQAFPSETQTALATVKLLWNNFILHYGFPSKIIIDQGRNFDSELIGEPLLGSWSSKPED